MTLRHPTARPGTIAPLLAVLVISLFSFVALAVDLGMLNIARTESQAAADAAALVGARRLNNRPAAVDNDVAVAQTDAQAAVTASLFLSTTIVDDGTAKKKITVTPGLYDYDTGQQKFIFKDTKGPTDAGKSWTAVRVTIDQNQSPYFSRILGVNSLDSRVSALAVHRPRDIAFALDFTGSMKFGCTGNFASRVNGSTTGGLMNPDPYYPQFAHYQRYSAYTTNPNNSPHATTVTSRGNPLRAMQGWVDPNSGELLAPNNFSITTPGGPPCVKDFLYDPSNVATPATSVATVTAANLKPAFHRWNPIETTAGNSSAFIAATYDYTGYDATDTTDQHGPVPAPANFADQSDSPIPYVGDKWPRKYGATTSGTWDPTNTDGAAVTAAEYLGWAPKYASGSILPSTMPAAAPLRTVTTAPVQWTNFRDATWERYGYDLDVAHYILNRNQGGFAENGGVWDPRWDAGLPKDVLLNTANPPAASGYPPSFTDGKFKGYSMGPGYWGKTFWMWPPDPRWGDPAGVTAPPAIPAPLLGSINPASPVSTGTFAGVKDTNGNFICDWRRRFFLNRSGNPFNPQDDNDLTATGTQTVNAEMLRSGVGMTLNDSSGNWQINYPAVLAWIKSGPQVLPPNLRAGRVVYYTSIPSDVTTSGSTAVDLDKVFWKNYIDFVLCAYGADATLRAQQENLAGHEGKGWPEGVGPAVPTAATSSHVSNIGGVGSVTDPKPYMAYTDNPSRPRMHFWFGPLSMMAFLETAKANWWSGTIHEAQCWQLKAAINSVLDDIRNNHPNDYAGLAFFAHNSAYYRKIRSPMSQDWITAKNALFYPHNLVPQIPGSTTVEKRPFDSSFANVGADVYGNIPNANGGTDPNSGMALAYNLLSPATGLATDPTGWTIAANQRGRRGAAKVVVFESDGVPNAHQAWNLQKWGYASYYTNAGNGGSDPQGSSAATTPALDIVDQIVKPLATTNTSNVDSGYSLPNTPARVYAIGFGDLFSTPTATQQNSARIFLLNIQQHGGTSAATDLALPADQIITGDYQTRIDNLRNVLERIMQSGIQVALIE